MFGYSHDAPRTWDSQNNPYVLSTHAYTAEDVARDRDGAAWRARVAELEKRLAMYGDSGQYHEVGEDA